MADPVQVDAVGQLLTEKGLITEQEFLARLKKVQAEYESKKGKG
jgi:hypothetical protein